MLPVAVDAMGGDHAPEAIVAGAALAVRDGIDVILVGDRDVLAPLLPRTHAPRVVHAGDVVDMGETAAGVRRKPDASVRRAMSLVQAGDACAALSFGNTGATFVAACLDLGVFEGVERPGIATVLPRSDGGRLVMLDAGANVDCRPEQLACFARLGAVYAEVLGVERPRIGLLSNGEEDSKGNMQVRATLPLLRSLPLEVVGHVEPHHAMAGACDVLVCDGFVGNILLKAAEGAVSTVVQLLTEEVSRRPSGRLGAWLLKGAFKRFRNRVQWDAQGGALLLGTRGLVVIGHGAAEAEAVRAGVALASRAAQDDLLGALAQGMQEISAEK
jgi:glycerol-3-phosphate acyltransferase PlsX